MADTKISGLTAVTTPVATDQFAINEAGTSKRLTLAQIAAFMFTRIAGSSGAAGPYYTLQNLTSNSADNTSTTPAVVMTTTGVGAGTWYYKWNLIFQTAATATGIAFSVNHTGTAGQFSFIWQHVSSATGTANAIAEGANAVTAGSMMGGKAERVINTVSSACAGVTTADADIHAILEGLIEVSATGSLELKMATEVGGSAARVMADSCLELVKVE